MFSAHANKVKVNCCADKFFFLQEVHSLNLDSRSLKGKAKRI